MYKIFSSQTTCTKWSKEWSINLLKQLTFGPSVTIYPVRYNVIRPKIEEIWHIELPKTAKDLDQYSGLIKNILDIPLIIDIPVNQPNMTNIEEQPLQKKKPSFIESILSFFKKN